MFEKGISNYGDVVLFLKVIIFYLEAISSLLMFLIFTYIDYKIEKPGNLGKKNLKGGTK